MIDGLKPYPAYKDSGILWLGDVPEHWQIGRIKTLFREKDERSGESSGVLLSLTRAHGILPQTEASKRISLAEDLSKYRICRPGDLVMNRMQAWSGMFAVCACEGLISPDYSVFGAISSADVKYFERLFKTPMLVEQFAHRSKGIGSGFNRLYTPDFGAVDVVIPPLLEQSAIVRFLDHADRRIRRYVNAKKKLIALLNEQKQAIIHDAVSRGVNSDVRMKPSGVESLGVVPAHWEVGRLSQFFTLQRGFDITKDRQVEGTVPVVSSGGVSSYNDRPTCEGPGVLVGRKGTAGAVYYVGTDYWAHDTTLWVNDFKGNFPRFVYYVLIDLDLKRFDTGSANPTLNRNVIHPERLAFPPPREQRIIASSLDVRLEHLGRAVEDAKREMDLLLEYRSVLISDVVTGQLDVREAARLPDEPTEPEWSEDVEELVDSDDEADAVDIDDASADVDA